MHRFRIGTWWHEVVDRTPAWGPDTRSAGSVAPEGRILPVRCSDDRSPGAYFLVSTIRTVTPLTGIIEPHRSGVVDRLFTTIAKVKGAVSKEAAPFFC